MCCEKFFVIAIGPISLNVIHHALERWLDLWEITFCGGKLDAWYIEIESRHSLDSAYEEFDAGFINEKGPLFETTHVVFQSKYRILKERLASHNQVPAHIRRI